MAACPKCSNKIKFTTVLFALCPIWITCPACATRLAGNLLVEMQALAILIIAFLGGAGFVSLWETLHFSTPAATLILACGVLFVVLPNVYIALRYGNYQERG